MLRDVMFPANLRVECGMNASVHTRELENAAVSRLVSAVVVLTFVWLASHRVLVSPAVTIVCLSFHPMAKERMHALKGLACRKRVTAASSPAATCKQDAALTSPARHACGCARPSRARLCHRNSKNLSDGSKT